MFAVPTNVNAKQIGVYGATEFMLGIASTCENPQKTMDLINMIYTDFRVSNLLNYGIEEVLRSIWN